jgi:predicted methyltransferase
MAQIGEKARSLPAPGAEVHPPVAHGKSAPGADLPAHPPSAARYTARTGKPPRRKALIRALSIGVSVFFLACAGLVPRPAQAQSPHSHQHSFEGAEHWAKVFDDPERDAWQKPHQVIQALALKPDAAVADIGAGTGYFAARLAHFVPQGRVYAVDLEPDMVKYLADRARREALGNLSAIAGAPDDARLPGKVDLVLMVDVYHHIDQREAYFRKLAQSLKAGGRVVVIDFNAKSKMGPPPAQRIGRERVAAEMSKAGYRLAGEHHFLPNQYFLSFQPKDGG